MKISIFLSIVIAHCFLSTAEAQSKRKLYYSTHWELTKPDSAHYYRDCTLDTINYHFVGEVTDYLLNNQLVMKGRYDNSGKKNGEFTLYYIDGQVESTGEFTDDKRFGLWKYYFPNGKIGKEVTFTGDDFFVNSLFDSSGNKLIENGTGEWLHEYQWQNLPFKIIVSGHFEKGKKNGVWRCISSNGDLIYEETFKQNNFKKGILLEDGKKKEYFQEFQNKFLPPYKFVTTEKFVTVFSIKRNDYPFLGFLPLPPYPYLNITDTLGTDSDLIFSVVEEQATYNGGTAAFYEYIAKRIKYPVDAFRNKVEGKVFVEFIINRDGGVSDVKVIKGIGRGCDEEAVRVVSLSPPWNPGRQRGKPVRTRFVIPVTFRLGK